MLTTGAGTWIASQMPILANQGWPLWVFAGVGFAAALLLSVSAVANLRYRWSASNALNKGIQWNDSTFTPYAVIDGGTHSLSEIFGGTGVRSNLTFRNANIVGPGVAALFGSKLEKCDIAGVPEPVVIHMNQDFARVGNLTHVFHKCNFLNCVFYNLVLVDDPTFISNQTQQTHAFIRLDSDDLTSNYLAKLESNMQIENKSNKGGLENDAVKKPKDGQSEG
ncbi:hypothetical protein ACSQ76_02785 [Roseovarius sp. B08]|uniref:hypothetical protein n=1 Tax=Roseovarius sp. B08 TaxID=3449223 RepID=UPI003EDBB805